MQQKEKAKTKKANTPQQAPEGQPQAGKRPVKGKRKSKKKTFTFSTIVSMILILLIISVILVLYYDVFESQTLLANFFGLDNPTQEQTAALDQLSQELATQEEELEEKLYEYNELMAELNEMQESLDAKEAELDAKELELLESQQQEPQDEMMAEVTVDEEVAMFEQMDSEMAADAIAKMTDDDAVIKLLTSLTDEKAADILNYLDAKTTAEIMTLILAEETEPEE